MNREYCCTECGLIWFDNNSIANNVKCPECGNYIGKESDYNIFACDTFGWFYSSENAVKDLEKRDKKIHYHENHPWGNLNK